MKIAVTGSTGFAGRALVASLRAHKHPLCALVRGGSDARARARLAALGAEIVTGDVCDEASLVRAFSGCEGVLHAAAFTPLRGSRQEHERVNLVGVENALSAAKSSGVKRFVLISCEGVTRGLSPRRYVDESHPAPAEFLDPHARTRALAEDLVIAAQGSGIETVCLRPATLWGPDDTTTLPSLLRAVHQGRFAWIDGGRGLFSSTYIDTLCDATALAMTVPEAAGGVFYVTDDEICTAREFLGGLLGAARCAVPRLSVPFALAYALAWVGERVMPDPRWTRAEVVLVGRSAHFNVQRARRVLGWVPGVSVAEGLSRTRAWIDRVGVERVIRAEVLEGL